MSGPIGSQQWMYNASSGFYPYELNNSLKFEDGDNSYLSRTPASAGNRKTWTWSGWFKRGNIGTEYSLFSAHITNTNQTDIYLNSTDTIVFSDYQSSSKISAQTSAVFRDTSSWYHIVVAVDTTQSTNSDGVKLYINGVQQTFTFSAYTQNLDTMVNSTNSHKIGSRYSSSPYYLDGYLTEVNFIDGLQLTPSSFGETKEGIWIPKQYSGSYGTNGFYLPFKETTSANGFNTVTYSGNGATQSIEGVGFSPDFVWVKDRTTNYANQLYDTVRGATKVLFSNLTNAESTDAQKLQSFDADGFTYGTNVGGNTNGNSYVAWCWDAGTGNAASNTDGSITSTVKANQDYGFSIVSYTGSGANATVGHGLSSAPKLILFKKRDVATSWMVYNHTIGNNRFLYLDNSNAQTGTDSSYFNDTDPTSTVISLGTYHRNNDSSEPYIAYCFSDVTNHQKIGSYTGNGSASGPTVTLGFKPAFLLIKRTDIADNWHIADNTRSTDGTFNDVIRANVNNAESADNSGFNITYNDTGFTLANTNSELNSSGGTYIYLAIADTRDALFTSDASGNGNNWTPNALQHSDVMPDTPTDGFSTYNHLATTSGFVNLSEGNLKATSAGSYWSPIGNTMYMSSGKWYWEIYVEAVGSSQIHGIVPAVRENGRTTFTADIYPGSYADEIGYRHQGSIYRANGGTPVATYSTYTTGDILGFALDMDNGTLDIYKNNSAAGAQFTGLSGEYRAASAPYGTSSKSIINFGQDSSFNANKIPQGNADDNGKGDFFYAPPTGHLALCNANLPDPAIDPNKGENPEDYFNIVLYTGNNATGRSITGVGFQPDWTWVKSRNTGGEANKVVDVLRGAGITLFPQSTSAEIDYQGVGFDSFDSDGFTISHSSSNNQWNVSGRTYVAWNWKAGGAGVSNTDGSITSTVSVNEDAGFSIVTYTGTGATATVGHGLSKAPNVTIIKPRNFSDNWIFTHDMQDGSDDQLYLNLTNANSSPSASFTVTQNASTIGLTSWNNVNDTSDTYVMYCFTEKDGFSKFGKYNGNGSTNGAFVYTGFRVAYLLVKQNSTANWTVYDNTRDPKNPVQGIMYPGVQGIAENTGTDRIDFLSNGFKWRESSNDNLSGYTNYYMAFAEQPFKYANAR